MEGRYEYGLGQSGSRAKCDGRGIQRTGHSMGSPNARRLQATVHLKTRAWG